MMRTEPAKSLIAAATNTDSIIHGSTAIRQKPFSALPLTLAMGRAFLGVGPAGQGEQACRNGLQQLPRLGKIGNIPLRLLGGPLAADLAAAVSPLSPDFQTGQPPGHGQDLILPLGREPWGPS
jgi:hypothetical protein